MPATRLLRLRRQPQSPHGGREVSRQTPGHAHNTAGGGRTCAARGAAELVRRGLPSLQRLAMSTRWPSRRIIGAHGPVETRSTLFFFNKTKFCSRP